MAAASDFDAACGASVGDKDSTDVTWETLRACEPSKEDVLADLPWPIEDRGLPMLDREAGTAGAVCPRPTAGRRGGEGCVGDFRRCEGAK